jgi:hypothetical protein
VLNVVLLIHASPETVSVGVEGEALTVVVMLLEVLPIGVNPYLEHISL